jgi:ArsR family transcriptional regulator
MKIPKSKENLQIFKTLADEARFDIVVLLASGPKCVCEIFEKLKLKQSIVSHHLGVLWKNGLVEISRDGKWVYYSLNRKSLCRLQKFIGKIIVTKQIDNKCR